MPYASSPHNCASPCVAATRELMITKFERDYFEPILDDHNGNKIMQELIATAWDMVKNTSPSIWVESVAGMASVIALFGGIIMLNMTKRGLKTNTTASLSSKMAEINKFELEHPCIFSILGSCKKLINQKR